MSEETQNVKSNADFRRRRPRLKSLKLPACTIGVLGVAVFLFALLTHHGGRRYFSPDSLRFEQQNEVLLPLSTIPIFRSSRSEVPNELVTFLTEQNYWQPVETSSPKWILVNHWNTSWRDGHSGLERELQWHRHEWIEWSKSNPETAGQLWPAVLHHLQNDAEHEEHAAEEMLMNARLNLTKAQTQP